MIRLEWNDFKQLFDDNTVKFKTIEDGKDFVIYAKDDWLEFVCNVEITNEDATGIINSSNSRAPMRVRKK